MEVEDEDVCRRKPDEQKKKWQKEPRDVDRLSFVTKEVQESILESLQYQLQEVEKRRHDLMLEHQKFQKRLKKIQSIQDKRKHMQKENAAADEEVRKLRDKVKQKEERILFLSDEVEKNRMADADMASGSAGRRREKEQQCFANRR